MHNTNNILVTGGAGFIGSNFSRYWLNLYPDEHVVVLDALTYAGNRSSLKDLSGFSNFSFIHGDILNGTLVREVLESNKIDTIVHFAAESHVDRSIHGPDDFFKN